MGPRVSLNSGVKFSFEKKTTYSSGTKSCRNSASADHSVGTSTALLKNKIHEEMIKKHQNVY